MKVFSLTDDAESKNLEGGISQSQVQGQPYQLQHPMLLKQHLILQGPPSHTSSFHVKRILVCIDCYSLQSSTLFSTQNLTPKLKEITSAAQTGQALASLASSRNGLG